MVGHESRSRERADFLFVSVGVDGDTSGSGPVAQSKSFEFGADVTSRGKYIIFCAKKHKVNKKLPQNS